MRLHGLICGRSGSGKSVFLQNLALELIRKSQDRRWAVLVIDVHGDLARAVMRFSIHANPTRLKYISTAINREAMLPDDAHVTAIINPFWSDGSPEMVYLLTETLTQSISELLVDTSLTVQMTAIIRPCLHTVLSHPDTASLAELNRFFLDGHNQDLIERGKRSTVEQYRTFFQHDWNADDYRISKRSIRTKLSYFLSDQRLANMLTGRPTVDIEKSLNDGDVLVFNLPKGSGVFVSTVMGKLMLGHLHAIMMRRDNIEPHLRKITYLIADEFQNYITKSLSGVLSESRKWGLAVCLATQSISAIEDAVVRKNCLVNTGWKAVGSTDYQDRIQLARELGIKADDIDKLLPLHFYLRRMDGEHTAFKFRVHILDKGYFLSKKDTKELLRWIVEESGVYTKIPPPPPPPPASLQPQRPPAKPPHGKTPTQGLKPAF